MAKTKFVPPIPTSVEDLRTRCIILEEEAMLRRKRKAQAMARWREKVRAAKENPADSEDRSATT